MEVVPVPPSTEPVQEFLGHIHSYSKLDKRKRTSRKQQFCRPIKTQYDPNRYAEFVLKLDRLKYLESREPMRPGQYVVRVSCMGQNYGHFLCGLADMGAFVTLARTPRELISKDNCPDIDLSETIGLQILFKDLMDNPVVLTLLDGRHECVPIRHDEDFSTLQPLGYLCLDMLELVNYEMGYTDEYCEPWILQKEKIIKHKKFPMGEPMIQFSVSCIGGLPGEDEMKNANVMTIMVESVHALSEELSKMDHNLKNDINVYISLPLEDTHTNILFNRGTYVDENSEKISKHKSKRKSFRTKSGKSMKPINHWASVLQHSQNIPCYATVIPEDTSEKPEDTTKFSGNMHKALDDAHWKNIIASSPKIVWNSLRKKFIDPDAYQKVLEEFSKYSVWPAEVAISVKKEIIIKKSIPKSKAATPSEHAVAVDVNNGPAPPTTNAVKTDFKSRYSVTPIQVQRRTSLDGSNETNGSHQSPGQQARQSPTSPEGENILPSSPEVPEVQYETTIIYHGIALFDLTQLLSPGITSVRFACQLFPYSDKLLYSKTCLRKSAFLSTIPGYVPATESKVAAFNNHLSRKSIVPHRKADKTDKSHEKGKHSAAHSKFAERHSHSHNAWKSTHSQDEEEHNEFENENGHETEKQPGRHSVVTANNRKSMATKGLEDIEEDHHAYIENLPAVTKSGAPVPFIVFEITMKNPIVPRYVPEDISRRIEEYIPNRNLPRRKIINAGLAQATYRRSVIQASADLCETFHSNYLEDVVNDPKNRELLDPENPASSCDALKKGFLLYLNATGRYLILREHLRHSIAHIIQQRCLTIKPNGFQTKQEFQHYLHDMYIYLVDQMHDVLSSTNTNESNPLIESQKQPPSSSGSAKSSLESNDKSEVLKKLCIYAEEALAQGDFENCHRLHLQRICRHGEDAGTWVDFAVMWLARGDDRMAEIAIREALRINPQHIYALLLAGIMAAKQSDKQAIDCVGSALGLQPSSPELMVILAMVYTAFKNDVASDYYFKNARYVHSVMTGSDTQNIQNEFNKLNDRFEAFKKYSDTQGIEDVIQQKEKDNISWLKLNEDPRMIKVKRNSKAHIDNFQNVKVHSQEVKTVKSNTTGEPKVASSVIGPQARNSVRPSKVAGTTPKESVANSVGSPKKDPSTGKVVPTVPAETKESLHAAKGKQPPRRMTIVQPQQFRPKFEFDTELSEESLKMTLPTLIPSVQTSWDVTDPANIAINVPSPIKLHRKASTSHSPTKIMSMATTSISTEPEVLDESDKEKSPHFHFNSDEFMAQFVQLYGEDGAPHLMVCSYGYPEEIGCEDDEYNIQNSTARLSKENTNSSNTTSTRNVSEGSVKNSSEDSNKNTNDGSNNLNEGSPKALSDSSSKQSPEVLPESPIKNLPESSVKPNKNMNENAEKEVIQNPIKKYTKRIGSEYIWTAQLLLNLRLFDLMDGVLAREVHMVEARSIPYLYLRSMSLYLRHRSSEALTYVTEALELNPTSATLWALKGHCLYRLNQHLEAIESYQKAVLLPHEKDDFHLVYLRFGCLCMDHAGEGSSLQLAKKIFRRGIHLYPSPYMWLAFGNTCYHLEQFDEAEEAFAEANRIDITSPMIWGHLALVSLARDDKALAEQSYKWAVRFGLREGPMVDEIKRMHIQKGFGDPTFPRIPDCIPHEYYLRRVGRELPFDIYKEALYQEPPAAMGFYVYNDTDRETELKKRLEDIKEDNLPIRISHNHSDIHVQIAHRDPGDEHNDKEPSPDKSHQNKKNTKDSHSVKEKERDKKLKASRTNNKHETETVPKPKQRKNSHKAKASSADAL